ncbi:hypothetical protein WR43_05570 [Mycolicibacter arupensis]|uniref:Uncharacterized protein n=2 Tax=Mycolicibacter TaxID=1073531 RepID=A0A0F5N267_9MYCO|nr:hypothetical protein WR43_05570 [Mycolicibacter arupensis]OQZ93697.1 hypothetical protein BST15_17405 [Mycolicibacter arupensis]ORW06581.1 hypothetical protein AWC16_01180 [Mycolicibacter longobardus]
MQATSFLLHPSERHKIGVQGSWPLPTPLTPIHFRLVIPVPSLIEPRYRVVIKIELRHDSRDPLADLKSFEFDSIELFGHLSTDGIMADGIATATYNLAEVPPRPAGSRSSLVGSRHIAAAEHS